MGNPNLSSFISSVADLLRGNYKQSEYGKVILPFTVLRRPEVATEPCSDCRSTRPTAMDSGHVTLTPHGGQDHHRVERQDRTDFHHTDC